MNNKVEYVSCNICGGIGNQLFQIATTLDYANKYNKIPIFKNVVDLYNQHGFERKTQWNTLFNNKLNVVSESDFNKIHFNTYNEIINNIYNEIPKIKGNILLNGYFQAMNYISKKTREKMQHLIYSNQDYMYNAYNLYNEIKKHFNDEDDDNYVAIHVRRGDYLYIQNFHNILDLSYYTKAYDIITKEKTKKIVVFSDDIEWCKTNFKIYDKEIYYIDTKNLCIE